MFKLNEAGLRRESDILVSGMVVLHHICTSESLGKFLKKFQCLKPQWCQGWGRTGTDYKLALGSFWGKRDIPHWIVVVTIPSYIFTPPKKKIIELTSG